MKISKTRRTILSSMMLILVCLISFTITTWAWFSDSVSSINNIIKVGNLDAEMYWTEDLSSGEWYNIEEEAHNAVFTYDNYEPGYTDVKYLKIVNTGSTAYKYDLSLLTLGEVGKLVEVIDLYYVDNVSSNLVKSSLSALTRRGTLKDNLGKSLTPNPEVLLPVGQNSASYDSHEVVVAIALQMQTTAGNEYQNQSIGDGFSIRLSATQFGFEEDSFDNTYDEAATFPVSVSTGIETDGGKVSKQANISAGLVNAIIPAGVSVESGTSTLTLTVAELDQTASNLTVSEDETLKALDVHVHGVSERNEVPMIITVNGVATKYLNEGNIDLYHVEDGKTIQMTRVNSTAELVAHNQFYYDAATGSVTLALASFSEITAKMKTLNPWKGGVNFDWYTNHIEGKPYLIYNGDQLNGLSQLVGAMASINGYEAVEFENETIKLVADIDLGYNGTEDYPIFYPIGYHNNTRSYKKQSGNEMTFYDDNNKVYSTVGAFKGTFDGNGHTIANFYQNTWDMFGDYNSGYSGTPNHYKDGFGLFGWVVDGTVQNLRIDNFSCDSEFGIAGIVAAYSNNSTFRNIAIVNSNPRVYNNGNGGIVGYVGKGNSSLVKDAAENGGNADGIDNEDTMTFENITVDSSNKITALWGTWDGCCAGILGRYNSQSKVILNNCHVAAQMDVFNDVCGNYQYYWYRYSAMLVGSIEVMTTDANDYVIPDLTNFETTSCTVHFGEWNDMYYCELVENSQASYTHDYQMTRLNLIESVSDIKDSKGNWTTTGDFIVLGKDSEGNETRTCYHIRKDAEGKLYERTHESKGTQVVDGETVLVEDKQCVYLPFNQVFQGWGWGVKNIPVTEENPGVKILDKDIDGSIVKFKPLKGAYSVEANSTIKLDDLFESATDNEDISKIHTLNVHVGVTFIDENGDALLADTLFVADGVDWTQGTITLPAGVSGTAIVTIQDYVFCKPTTILVHVHDHDNYNHLDSGHWNVCDCGYENKNNVNSHIYEEITLDGIVKKTCTVCGYFKYQFSSSQGNDLTAGIDEKFGLAIKVPSDGLNIAHLTDLHFGTEGKGYNNFDVNRTYEYISDLIFRDRPDLIVCGGDSVFGTSVTDAANNNVTSLAEFVNFMEQFHIPWVFVFGASDVAGSKLDYHNYLMDCVTAGGAVNTTYLMYADEYSEVANANVSGDKGRYGNYSIQLVDETGKNLLGAIIVLDSGVSINDKFYQSITSGQVGWYQDKVNALQKIYATQDANFNSYVKVPTVVFTHMQSPEHKLAYQKAMLNQEGYEFVIRQDSVYDSFFKDGNPVDFSTSTPSDNSLFNKMVELGSTKAYFSGHSHDFNYQVNAKGIILGYAPMTGFSKLSGNNDNPREAYIYNFSRDLTFTSTNIVEQIDEPKGLTYSIYTSKDETPRISMEYDSKTKTYYGLIDLIKWGRIRLRYNGKVLTPDNTKITGDYGFTNTDYKINIIDNGTSYMSSTDGTNTYAFTYNPETNVLDIRCVKGLTVDVTDNEIYKFTINGAVFDFSNDQDPTYDALKGEYSFSVVLYQWQGFEMKHGGQDVNLYDSVLGELVNLEGDITHKGANYPPKLYYEKNNPNKINTSNSTGGVYNITYNIRTNTITATHNPVSQNAVIVTASNNFSNFDDSLNVWDKAGTILCDNSNWERDKATNEATKPVTNGWRYFIVVDSEGRICLMTPYPLNGYGNPLQPHYYANNYYRNDPYNNPAYVINADGTYDVVVPEGGFAIAACGSKVTELLTKLGIENLTEYRIGSANALPDNVRIEYAKDTEGKSEGIVIISK